MGSRNASHEKDNNGERLPSIWHIMNDVPSEGARGYSFMPHQSNGAGPSAIPNPNLRTPTPQGYLPPPREISDSPYGAPGHPIGSHHLPVPAIGSHHLPVPRLPPAARTFGNRSLPDIQRLEVQQASSPNVPQQSSDVFQPVARPSPAQEPQPQFIGQQQVPGGGQCYVYSDGSVLPCEIDGQAVNPVWRTTKQGKARKRLPQACDRCRDKKVRCEGGDPCGRCFKLSERCRWSSNARPNRKSSPAPAGSTAGGRPGPIVHKVPPVPVPRPEAFVSNIPPPTTLKEESASKPNPFAFEADRSIMGPPSAPFVTTSPPQLAPPEHTREPSASKPSPFTFETKRFVTGPLFEPYSRNQPRRETASDQDPMELERRKRPRVVPNFPFDILTGWRDSTTTQVNGNELHQNEDKPVGESSTTNTPAEAYGVPLRSPISELPDLLDKSSDRRQDELLSSADFVRRTNESIAANADCEAAWYTAIAFGAAYSKTPELKSLADSLNKKWKRCEKASDLVEEMHHKPMLKAQEVAAKKEAARLQAEDVDATSLD